MTAAAASNSSDNATEVAQVISELVVDRNVLAEADASELRRLLAHSLTAPSPAELRSQRLGLLIDLVAESEGEFISTSDFEAARVVRRERGEEHPDASTLSRAFGHWLAAVKAACRFWYDGGQARVPSSNKHGEFRASYEPREIQRALIEARRDLAGPGRDPEEGEWPTEWEFLEYCSIRRRLARKAGKHVRLPSAKQVRKAYGTFAEAVQAARNRLIANEDA